MLEFLDSFFLLLPAKNARATEFSKPYISSCLVSSVFIVLCLTAWTLQPKWPGARLRPALPGLWVTCPPQSSRNG